MADIPSDVDVRIDALFALDPSEFIVARDRDAKELRAAGRGEDAAFVKALRRPTVAAWALNQVVRAQPDAIAEFLALSDDLRAEQEAALSGDATKFRRLLDRRRELERQVVNAAVDLLAESSSNAEQSRAELTGTLGAAAVDDEVADAVRRGRLERIAAAPSGFDLLAGLELPAARPKPAKPTKQSRPPPAPPVDELAARRAGAEAAREQARAAAARAERVEAAATRRQQAKAAADEARKVVRRLETDLARARRVADRADAELDQAKETERRARS